MEMSLEEKALGFVFGSLSPDERSFIEIERLYNSALDTYIRNTEQEFVGLETCSSQSQCPSNLWSRIISTLHVEKEVLSNKYVEECTAGQWQRHSDNIDIKTLWSDEAILIRCNPGGFEDAHDQPIDKDEHIIVIAGDLEIGGRLFSVGDYICISAGSVHDRMSSSGGCLIFTEYRSRC